LIDPTEEQRKRPLAGHLREFKNYLANKGATFKQVAESTRQLQKMVDGCKWKFIGDIASAGALEFLGQLRRDGRSAQTCNHYLKIAKQFTRWLVRDRRAPENVLEHLSRMNVRLDRRHDRRALSDDEFRRLVEAARSGPRVEGIDGADRAMMYVLAAWTGFRKGEIGSLTLRSLRLDDDPPTATVAACYSKHRREDTQVLHPELVRQLKEWLAAKDQLHAEEPLFPISGRVPGGLNRKTHKMIERDLMAARDKWLDEAETPEEYDRRLKSDFLCYCNHDSLYADFHGLRHLFITRLERAGVSPKMAQTLARHSDIRLTLGIYTHLEVNDQAAAICSLPAPPGRAAEEASAFMAETGAYGRKDVTCKVPTVVPRGAENGAVQLTSPAYQRASICTETAAEQSAAR